MSREAGAGAAIQRETADPAFAGPATPPAPGSARTARPPGRRRCTRTAGPGIRLAGGGVTSGAWSVSRDDAGGHAVGGEGLEPSGCFEHQPLKATRLPVSPLARRLA